MDPAPPVYGLDIETDTRRDGLDPTVAAVVGVAVATPESDHVLVGPEPRLLADLDEVLRALPPGVLVTWNGSGFDLPFLADRAARLRVGLGLTITADPALPTRADPLPGHQLRYRGGWYDHTHVDAYLLYRADLAPVLGRGCGLKTIATAVGLPTVEVDASRIHELERSALEAYVASDARLARQLALRRWPSTRLALDRHSRVVVAAQAEADRPVAVA